MKKIIKALLFSGLMLVLSAPLMAQQFLKLSGFGYESGAFKPDSVTYLPSRDTSFGSYPVGPAIVLRTVGGDRTFYAYNGIKWVNITAALSNGIASMYVSSDTIYTVLVNHDTLKTPLPLYAPTSSDGSISFSGIGKLWQPLNITVNAANIPKGLSSDSAVYDLIGDTGITVLNGTKTQFFPNIRVKSQYGSPIWNAGSIVDTPVSVGNLKDYDILAFLGGVWTNLQPTQITRNLKINLDGDSLWLSGPKVSLDTIINKHVHDSADEIRTEIATAVQNATPANIIANGGNATFNGDGTTTTFTVTDGVSGIPWEVLITPTSADAAKSEFYVSAKNDGSFAVTVAWTTPPAGTGNVTFDWIVVNGTAAQ